VRGRKLRGARRYDDIMATRETDWVNNFWKVLAHDPPTSHAPHRALALEDTLDVDIFDPPREDWLTGTDAYLRR
jgi:hypothetical protein